MAKSRSHARPHVAAEVWDALLAEWIDAPSTRAGIDSCHGARALPVMPKACPAQPSRERLVDVGLGSGLPRIMNPPGLASFCPRGGAGHDQTQAPRSSAKVV